MDLRGWVRNLDDGRVELLAIGQSADLDRLVDAWRLGPSAAAVSDVTVSDIDPPNAVQGFEIQA
jgi:acylphosphatase